MKVQILDNYDEFDLAISHNDYMWLCCDSQPIFIQENFSIGDKSLVPNQSKVVRISHSPSGTHTQLHIKYGWLLYRGILIGTEKGKQNEKQRFVVFDAFDPDGKNKIEACQRNLFGHILNTGYGFLYFAFYDFENGHLAVSKSNATCNVFRPYVELLDK